MPTRAMHFASSIYQFSHCGNRHWKIRLIKQREFAWLVCQGHCPNEGSTNTAADRLGVANKDLTQTVQMGIRMQIHTVINQCWIALSFC